MPVNSASDHLDEAIMFDGAIWPVHAVQRALGGARWYLHNAARLGLTKIRATREESVQFWQSWIDAEGIAGLPVYSEWAEGAPCDVEARRYLNAVLAAAGVDPILEEDQHEMVGDAAHMSAHAQALRRTLALDSPLIGARDHAAVADEDEDDPDTASAVATLLEASRDAFASPADHPTTEPPDLWQLWRREMADALGGQPARPPQADDAERLDALLEATRAVFVAAGRQRASTDPYEAYVARRRAKIAARLGVTARDLRPMDMPRVEAPTPPVVYPPVRLVYTRISPMLGVWPEPV